MSRKDSEDQKKSMSVMFRGRAIFKPLNTGYIDERVACVREWVVNIFFYTKNGTTIMIDAGYNYDRLREAGYRSRFDPAHSDHSSGHRPRRSPGDRQRAAVPECNSLYRRD